MEPRLTDRFEQTEILFLAIKLSVSEWKLAFSDGRHTEVKSIDARHFGHLKDLVETFQGLRDRLDEMVTADGRSILPTERRR